MNAVGMCVFAGYLVLEHVRSVFGTLVVVNINIRLKVALNVSGECQMEIPSGIEGLPAYLRRSAAPCTT